jgi:NAD+ synthase (glutamine-hydrolysing)
MASRHKRVAMAQLDFLVGDLAGNAARVLDAVATARDEHKADLIVFPELVITGYPPEDLLLRPGFLESADATLDELAAQVTGIAVILGHTYVTGTRVCNAASVLSDGERFGPYLKQSLPNYTVFDEQRYFSPGDEPLVVDLGGVSIGVLICEDIWEPLPARMASDAGAELLVVVNASPWYREQDAERNQALRARFRDTGKMIVYVNTVGGQDDLVFDGQSRVLDGKGEIAFTAPAFREGLFLADLDLDKGAASPVGWEPEALGEDEIVYRALVTGLRDYVQKNGFPFVLLGLSGGIDSALTLAIAVDALGPERVYAVMMPTRYTADMSVEDARSMAEALGVRYSVIPIEDVYESLLGTLTEAFAGHAVDVTEENIQARCRGVVLMALSNKFGGMVLATSNKSETAVGYTTLYGDMCGGYAPIKDVYKTLVYRLARYRNTQGQVIPQRVLERAPSAELAHDQKDQDSLPPYELLDEILERYVERDCSMETIIEEGYERAVVERVSAMVLRNEYKRRQSAPGTRITKRAFGRDRRYPITSGWKG